MIYIIEFGNLNRIDFLHYSASITLEAVNHSRIDQSNEDIIKLKNGSQCSRKIEQDSPARLCFRLRYSDT